MRAIEQQPYVDGWDARLMEKPRAGNPHSLRAYPGAIRRPAWESYRERAWDRGWTACDRCDRFVDPRKPRQRQRA